MPQHKKCIKDYMAKFGLFPQRNKDPPNLLINRLGLDNE